MLQRTVMVIDPVIEPVSISIAGLDGLEQSIDL
jgi:hypothetical protein